MSVPLFHVVKTDEFGLSGIGNPSGGDHGSMHMPTLSMKVDDCAITSGEVELPEGYAEAVYQAKFLMFDLAVINVGEAWPVPNAKDNPEMFITWPCNNPSGLKQLKEFVIVTLYDAADKLVKEVKYPGLFNAETFLRSQIYFISRRNIYGGQRVQMNHVPDGTYRIEICVNPVYGQCNPAVCWVKFTGHDLVMVLPPELPEALVWQPFSGSK